MLTFSGSHAGVSLANGPLARAAGGLVDAVLLVSDANGNPMPAGTKIELTTSFGTAGGQVLPASHVVCNYPLGIRGIAPGRLFVKVTTPNNVVSQATLPIN